MAFAKFEENRFRIDGEISENHAILVNLTAGIGKASSHDTHYIIFICTEILYCDNHKNTSTWSWYENI